MTTDNKTVFLALNSSINNGEPYINHGEGFVVDKNFFTGEGEKKSVLRMNVRISRNPWIIFGEAEVEAQTNNPGVNAEKPFITVTAFGQLAEDLNSVLVDKAKIVFTGKAVKNEFKRKDGSDGVSINVLANNAYMLACKAAPKGSEKAGSTIVHSVSEYTQRNSGQTVKEDLVCLLAGTVKGSSKVAEYNGRSVVNFDFEVPIPAKKIHALGTGTYQKDADYGNYRVIRCAVWGPRATHLDSVLAPGNILVVTGSTKVNSYKDQDYVNMTLKELSVMSWVDAPKNNQSAPAPASAAPAPSGGPGYEDGFDEFAELLDDDAELPF